MKRIVVIGGGMSGLATARALERALSRCAVQVLEAAPQLGGTVRTLRHNAFTIDAGPSSWAADETRVTQLASELGVGDEVTSSRADRHFILWQRRLHPVPDGLFVDLSTPLRPLLDGELLDWDTKARALLDRVAPRRIDGDESIASLLARRFGRDVVERLGEPILGAAFMGDVSSLSADACIPRLVDAERERGSLLAAARDARDKKDRSIAHSEGGGRLSLKRGVGDLVVTLAHKLRDAEVFTSRAALRIADGGDRARWIVETGEGPLLADDVVLALPGHRAAPLVDALDEELASAFRELEYASSASVFLAYRKFDVRHPLDSGGILVPCAEGRPMREVAFVSTQWEHRAPGGQVLLRMTFGGGGREDVLGLDDDELVQSARDQLRDLLAIVNPPLFTKVFRFDRTTLQPTVGHEGRVRRIRALCAKHPGLHVGADAFRGGGIDAAVRGGDAIAAAITPLRDTTS